MNTNPKQFEKLAEFSYMHDFLKKKYNENKYKRPEMKQYSWDDFRGAPLDRMHEICIWLINPKLNLISQESNGGKGKSSIDFDDKSDAKSCKVRLHSRKSPVVEAEITSLKLKTGGLRTLVCDGVNNKAYFFCFHNDFLWKINGKNGQLGKKKGLDIPFDFDWNPKRETREERGWASEVESYEEMALYKFPDANQHGGRFEHAMK
jgi:hypothetical protein